MKLALPSRVVLLVGCEPDGPVGPITPAEIDALPDRVQRLQALEDAVFTGAWDLDRLDVACRGLRDQVVAEACLRDAAAVGGGGGADGGRAPDRGAGAAVDGGASRGTLIFTNETRPNNETYWNSGALWRVSSFTREPGARRAILVQRCQKECLSSVAQADAPVRGLHDPGRRLASRRQRRSRVRARQTSDHRRRRTDRRPRRRALRALARPDSGAPHRRGQAPPEPGLACEHPVNIGALPRPHPLPR